jgi:hypothetical protein
MDDLLAAKEAMRTGAIKNVRNAMGFRNVGN